MKYLCTKFVWLWKLLSFVAHSYKMLHLTWRPYLDASVLGYSHFSTCILCLEKPHLFARVRLRFHSFLLLGKICIDRPGKYIMSATSMIANDARKYHKVLCSSWKSPPFSNLPAFILDLGLDDASPKQRRRITLWVTSTFISDRRLHIISNGTHIISETDTW